MWEKVCETGSYLFEIEKCFNFKAVHQKDLKIEEGRRSSYFEEFTFSATETPQTFYIYAEKLYTILYW